MTGSFATNRTINLNIAGAGIDVDRLNGLYEQTLENNNVERFMEHATITGAHSVKLAGAAYLIWIGIKAIRSKGLSSAHERPSQPLAVVFRQSVIGNLLNPKVTLFFIVFLPQFVNPHGGQSVMLQMFELGGVFMLQTVAVFSVFGLAAGMIGAYLKRRPKVGVWLDRLAGATFIGLGIRVALKD